MSLPPRVLELLEKERAPPRLVAHLTLVHDVAGRLLRAQPHLGIDRARVRLGAATHDVGKARVLSELSQSGRTHEALGESLLREAGFDAATARFARTHGVAPEDPALTLEDLLVQAADSLWKGRRDQHLDAAIVRHLGEPAWQHFLVWDELASTLTDRAADRLAWQRQFPIGE